MHRTLDTIGTLIGALGVVLCLASGVARLSGVLAFLDSDIITWFVLGIALIATGCFVLLRAIALNQR